MELLTLIKKGIAAWTKSGVEESVIPPVKQPMSAEDKRVFEKYNALFQSGELSPEAEALRIKAEETRAKAMAAKYQTTREEVKNNLSIMTELTKGSRVRALFKSDQKREL